MCDIFDNDGNDLRVSLVSTLPLPGDGYRSHYVPFPSEYWDRGEGRRKASFGTEGVVLSISQAKKRKLVKWSPLHQVYVRACWTRREEDRRMRAYDEKQATKAKPVTP